MSENNHGRFVKICNFRNLGIGKTAQTLFLNHTDYDGEYIGDLILLIGPNNAGKSNLLDALNLLNENLSFSSNDLPNAIKNESKDTFIRFYEYPSDDEENNDGAKEIITKYTYGEKNPPKETFSEWKEGVRRWIESMLEKHMQAYGYKDLLQFIASSIPKIYWNNQEYSLVSNFFKVIDDWTFEELIKTKWWEKDLGKIEFKSRTPYYNNNISTAYETIFNKELIDYLNKLIELENQTVFPLLSHSSKTFNTKFLKYHPWKIDDTFFRTKYKGQWNEFFENLFTELGIKQKDIIHGIWSKQRYYEQLVKDGLKKISDCFNNLFKTSGYLYEFSLFFNEETISFEINLVKQNAKDDDQAKIIPCIYDEQSTGFKYFFNLYFGLLIGQTHKLKKGDVILINEPISNLQVAGIIELHSILKQFTKATGISILLSPDTPFLVDFDYLDEIRLVDCIDGISTVNNNFQFNNQVISKSLNSILHSLITYPSCLFKCNHPTFIWVNSIDDYNYLTGYKLHKIKQIKKQLTSLATQEKDNLLKLLNQYESLIFIPFNDLGQNENNYHSLVQLIDNSNNERDYKFLVNSSSLINEFKNQFAAHIIDLKELVSKIDNDKDFTISSLISKTDQEEIINESNDYHPSVGFKYEMIDGKVSKGTYQNLDELFNNLLSKLNSNK